MSDYDVPDLPSDEELGITEDDIKALEEEAGRTPAPEKATEPPKRKPEGPGKASPSPAEPGKTPPPPPAGAPPAPGGRFRGPVTLLVLLLLAVVSTQWWVLPSPVPANAPDTAFSSARAMTQLVEVARDAHPTGSPEHDRVRAYLLDELRDLGLDPEVQTTTSMVRGADVLRAATVRNVVARIPGSASTGTVLLTAHYDGREISRAAADDGFGVVTILETVRALLTGPPLRNDLLILLTDAEELGLLGARAFVDEHPLADEIRVALSVEMRGGGGASIMFETGAQNGWIVREYAEHAPRPLANSIGYEVYRRLPNDTDFTPLKEAGIQGLNFAGIGKAHLYHQAYDAPENVSEATLQHHGLQILPMARALGEADLATVEAPDVTYFSVPLWGMVVYGDPVTWGVSAGLLLFFLLTLLLVRKRGGGWGGMAVGLGAALVAGGASWALGSWLVGWLTGFHPERGALQGSTFHSEGWYVLALAAAAFVLVTVLFGLARRRFSLGALALGAAVLPLVGALAAPFLAPMAAMDLQWPAAGALVGAAAVSGVGARSRMGWTAWLVTLVAAVPVLLILVTLTEFLWLAMSFRLAGPLGVLLTLLFVLLLPALDTLREPNGWWAPVTGLVAAGAFLGIGILLSEPSPERPLPTTLTYALDRETGEARWLTQPVQEGVDPASDPARAWAVAQVGQPFDSAWTSPWFLQPVAELSATPARGVEAGVPQVAVVADTVVEGERRVSLALRSEIRAEMLLVHVPDGTTLRSVNGRALPTTDRRGGAVEPVTRMSHWGRPDEAVLVELTVPVEAERLTLPVVEHLLRPEELLGEAPWRRPPDLAPNIVRNSDRALIRTALTVALTRGTPPDSTGVPGG